MIEPAGSQMTLPPAPPPLPAPALPPPPAPALPPLPAPALPPLPAPPLQLSPLSASPSPSSSNPLHVPAEGNTSPAQAVQPSPVALHVRFPALQTPTFCVPAAPP